MQNTDFVIENGVLKKYKGEAEVIEIPDGVTEIYVNEWGDPVFEHCWCVKKVIIPASVQKLDVCMFLECDDLTSICVDPQNPAFCADADGVLYNKEKTKLIFYPTGKNRTDFAVPESVTEIGECAFWGCGKSTSVAIPAGVKQIGRSAFFGCSNLITIPIPNGVKIIDELTFGCCDSLTSVTIPSSVEEIVCNAFSDCPNLKAICVDVNNPVFCSDEHGVLYNKEKTELLRCPQGLEKYAYIIPDSVSKIGWSAFDGCKHLVKIALPYTLRNLEIGHAAFHDCPMLEHVFFQRLQLFNIRMEKDNADLLTAEWVPYHRKEDIDFY